MNKKQKVNKWKFATIILVFIIIGLIIFNVLNYIQVPKSNFEISSMSLNKITSNYTIGKPYFLCKTETEYMTLDSIESLTKFGVDYRDKCILIRRIEK